MYAGTGSDGKRRYTVAEIAGAFAVSRKTIYRHLDPAIESHYGTGYERSRLFPGGNPALKFVRSMELLDRLLPGPPARLLDVGGGPGSCAHASSELALGGGRDGLIVGGDQVPGRQRFPGRDTHQSVRADPASACCTANMTLALAGSMSAAKWLTKSSSDSQPKPCLSVNRCASAGVAGPWDNSAPQDRAPADVVGRDGGQVDESLHGQTLRLLRPTVNPRSRRGMSAH